MNKSIFNIPNPKALASKIKLISFDLDGTLLGTSGKISSDSLKEIARIKKMGVAMAIATGRPLFSCEEIIDQVGVEGASMFFAGSLVIDVFTRIPVFENHLSKEVVKNLVKFSRSNKLSLELYTG
ncbi:MAG: HAD hydrolase family protein, partial [bacterium]|nr:HAD hydrolase family protein [bacterium]